jgi:hypothetical protein
MVMYGLLYYTANISQILLGRLCQKDLAFIARKFLTGPNGPRVEGGAVEEVGVRP